MADSQRYPLQGTKATAVTGEAVYVCTPPNLAALRLELQKVLDAGGWVGGSEMHVWHAAVCCCCSSSGQPCMLLC